MIRYLLPAVLLIGCGGGGTSEADEAQVRDAMVAHFVEDPEVQKGCFGLMMLGDDGRKIIERQIATDLREEMDADDGADNDAGNDLDPETVELLRAILDEQGEDRVATIAVDAMLEACLTQTDE